MENQTLMALTGQESGILAKAWAKKAQVVNWSSWMTNVDDVIKQRHVKNVWRWLRRRGVCYIDVPDLHDGKIGTPGTVYQVEWGGESYLVAAPDGWI